MDKKFLCIILCIISLLSANKPLTYAQALKRLNSKINFSRQELENGEESSTESTTKEIGRVNATAQINVSTLNISAKAAYLIDSETKTPLFVKNEEEKLPIASMCKIMTLLLAFEEIKSGNLTLNDMVFVSQAASSMGGSQAFLRENEEYLISDLIKSIIISSANDSCVAIAEKIGGTTDAFVEKMNQKAGEIGMHHTVFTNCTGLPKPGQFSCAKDVAIMTCELLNHSEYFNFSKIWMDKIKHRDDTYTELTNTNKLIRSYSGCDGGKTGYTAEAQYCLSATAMRDNLRLVSVIIGAQDSKTRFKENIDLLNYGFSNFKNERILSKDVIPTVKCPVRGGKEKSVFVKPQKEIFLFCAKGDKPDLRFETVFHKNIKAPVTEGQEVGRVIVYSNGVEVGKSMILAANSVKKKSFKDFFTEIAQNLFSKKL